MSKQIISSNNYTKLCENQIIESLQFRTISLEDLEKGIKKGDISESNIQLCDIIPIEIKLPNRLSTISQYIVPNFNTLEKADYGGTEARVGEIRNYAGIDKQKQADGSWIRYYGNELASGKITEEQYHKNNVSLRTSKIKEAIKKLPKEQHTVENASNIYDQNFNDLDNVLHKHYKSEILNKLGRDGVVTGVKQQHTVLSKLFARTPVPLKKISEEIEEKQLNIPSGMSVISNLSLQPNDKVKIKTSFGEMDAILQSKNENGTANFLIPSKRARVTGIPLDRVITKYDSETGEEIAVLVDKDYKYIKNQRKTNPNIVTTNWDDELDDGEIRIIGDEDLEEDAKKIGTTQVMSDEDENVAPVMSVKDKYRQILTLDKGERNKDSIEDFLNSTLFIDSKHKDDQNYISKLFDDFNMNYQSQKMIQNLNKIIN